MQDKFFAAHIDHQIITIDLHGTDTISDALDQLEKELFRVFNTSARYCKVVHGIGTGKLAEAVHTALHKNPLVFGFQESEYGGSCVVLF